MQTHSYKIFYSDAENKYGSNKPFYTTTGLPSFVTIKPTLVCPARCDHCFARRKAFSSNTDPLNAESWGRVFSQLKKLGTESLCISGGEPMLYKGIYDLIYKASKRGLKVSLNTSGWLFNKKEKIKRLVDSGLLAVHLSIDSPKAEIHDGIRHIRGLHQRALDSIELMLDAKQDFLLDIRMILHKKTFRDIPEMVRLVKERGATSLSIDHIEHDQTRRMFLLNAQELIEFRNSVRPKIIEQINGLSFENNGLREVSLKQINSLFSNRLASDEQYQNGIYWKDAAIKRHCTIPSSFMIIEGDGTVLPCNPVEYTRDPIMGNLQRSSIEDIWTSSVWENFRRTKFDYCNQCAMNQSITIPFREQITRIIPPRNPCASF